MKYCKNCTKREKHGFCRELNLNQHVPKKCTEGTKNVRAESCVGYKADKKRGD